MKGPLEGVRVLEISQFISAPYCGAILGDLGAEVIKVEPKIGDVLRILTSLMHPDFEVFFCTLNRNKKGIALDLRKKESVRIVRELASKSDILIENLGPGIMEKFGLGYEEISKINPRIVYVSISGFGKTGPYKDRTAFDIIAQAAGGSLPLMGRVGNKPKMFIADIISGVFAALGAISALHYREKTGKGQLVDLSMQDVVFSINIGAILEVALGAEKLKSFNFSFTDYPPGLRIPLYGIFPALDGEVVIGAVTDAQAKRLFEAMGKLDLLQDEKFSTFISRFRNDDELIKIISEWTSKRRRDEIVDLLAKYRVPCSPVYQLSEIKNDRQLKEREMFVEVQYKGLKVLVHGVCLKFSETPGKVIRPAPELNQHAHEILKNVLGYPEEEIEKLKYLNII